MDNKKLTGWLYLVSTVWYLIGVIRLTRSGLASGLICLCLGSAFFCFAAAQANRAKKLKETEEENHHDHTL